jgi:hypothetical protein
MIQSPDDDYRLADGSGRHFRPACCRQRWLCRDGSEVYLTEKGNWILLSVDNKATLIPGPDAYLHIRKHAEFGITAALLPQAMGPGV